MLITRSYARRLVREGKAVELALASPDGLTDIVTLSRRGGSGRMDWYYPHGIDVRRILGGASRIDSVPLPQVRGPGYQGPRASVTARSAEHSREAGPNEFFNPGGSAHVTGSLC